MAARSVQPDCQLEAPEPLPSRELPAIWMWIGLLVAVLIFDVWALKTKRRTLSQLVQRLSRRRWFRAFGLVVLGLFGWHIFWGFPW